jgi:fructose-specific component phosphotransferase system IIB-like protein
MIFMIVLLFPLFAADGSSGLENWGIIGFGAIISAILTFLTIRGEQNGQVGGLIGNIRNKTLSQEKIDKAVESVLEKFGVPALLADKLGDLVALVFWKLPDWVGQNASFVASSVPRASASGAEISKVESAVKAELVKAFTDSHPAEVAALLPGLQRKAYLVADNRARIAQCLAADNRITSIIREAIPKEALKRQVMQSQSSLT